ncbi:MAG: ROK family protein [Victivallales bacterium]|nr:ROK family protein [Victivallales bacterium]
MRSRILVTDAIREGKNSFSKRDIRNETGVVWGTMCKIVDSLLAEGCIFARREIVAGRGRPAIPLCVNPDSAYFMGIDIGAGSTKAIICDLAFNTVYSSEVPTPEYKGSDAFFSWLLAFYDETLQKSGIDPARLKAAGVSISGNVDLDNGIIVSGGNFGIKWGENLPVVEKLSSHAGVPALALPTQSAAVWGEYYFGRHKKQSRLVAVGLGVGIGSGVVVNHRLLISRPGAPVGYIGHIHIPGNEYLCACGFKGCIEAYSGGRSLARVAAEKIPGSPELHNAPALDRAAAAGNPAAMEILVNAASYISVGVASMIQLYSPAAVVFYGGQARRDGFLFRRIIQELTEIIPAERREELAMEISVLGDFQSALGAARLAYEKFF